MFERKCLLVVEVDSPTFAQCCVSQAHWVAAAARSHCSSCQKAFSLFCFKQHCRLCGDVICGTCRRIVLLRAFDRPMHEGRKAKLCIHCVAESVEDTTPLVARRYTLTSTMSSRGIDVAIHTPHATSVRASTAASRRQSSPATRPSILSSPTEFALTTTTSSEVDCVQCVSALSLTDAAPTLHHLVHVLASTLNCSMAYISIIDATHEWVPAAVGIHIPIIPKHRSVSAPMIASRCPMVVPDTTAVSGHPAIAAHLPHVRFFAAAPVLNRAGHVLGSVAVMDATPRTHIEASVSARLCAVAKRVAAVLEPPTSETPIAARQNNVESTLRHLLRKSIETDAILTQLRVPQPGNKNRQG
ncbi:Aste57867_15351 [Aphanomyces stellatus]|uniref:Aste57867_15351 protein n=1 Tax=Aphanomyces stellatus TaxID=120398 RepID=A0A485L2Y7_9STRA|nr:hypothetical protein As57867_015295 [Aphanomyces stellatus]VFT92159.1 Aste57867_15351 [Aphanomyces stellatus]